MLVGERMSRPGITTGEDVSIHDALETMKREKIRRMPVVKNGKLIGIVSDKDLLNASPSQATSLSVWELNYLLSKVTVKGVMTRKVITVNEDTPIEEAARIMADHKIGGLPVVKGDQVVGIITETDLFKIFLELMGARESGVRATVLVPNQPGVLAKLTHAIAAAGGNILALGTFEGQTTANKLVTIKVAGIDEAHMRELLASMVETLIDMRTSP